MGDKIIKAVVFKSYRPKTDGSTSITFETQEQTPQEVAEMHSLRNQYGVLYFKAEDQLTKDEIRELDNFQVEYSGKSQSVEIKNLIYVLGKLIAEKQGEEYDKVSFYKEESERIKHYLRKKIEKIKE